MVSSEVAIKAAHGVRLEPLAKGTNVNKLAVTLLGAALFAGVASAATDTRADPASRSGTYYGLHPKLGMVKVDRATNAMVVTKRDKERAAASAATPSR